MPKQTFFNLPADKRESILNVALDEFAEKGYKPASISQMVAAAGIAKGSFYQYFENKDDLYIYIVTELIAEKKLQAYQEEKQRLADLNLTEFLRVVFHRQIREFQQDPRLLKIGVGLLQITDEPVYRSIMKRYQGTADTYFLQFIQYEMNQGEIDTGVNAQLLNFMLISLGQYLISLLGEDRLKNLGPELIDRVVDDLDYILTHGIYGKGGTNHGPGAGNP